MFAADPTRILSIVFKGRLHTTIVELVEVSSQDHGSSQSNSQHLLAIFQKLIEKACLLVLRIRISERQRHLHRGWGARLRWPCQEIIHSRPPVLIMMQIRMSSPTHAHELDEAIATRIHTFDRRVLVRAHEEIPGQAAPSIFR